MFTNSSKTMCGSYLRALFAFSIVSTLAFLPPTITPSQASDITLIVDTHGDSNAPAYQVCSPSPDDCSLRGAISVANSDPGNHYIIALSAGTYPVSLPGASEDDNNSGDLDLKGDITLFGSDDGVIIMSYQIDRVIHIQRTAQARIENIQISGGKSPDGIQGDGQPGGGIYNQGSLALINCLLKDNQAGNGDSATVDLYAGAGGSGGGIQNDGQLTIEDSVLRDNAAGAGGKGYICQVNYPGEFCFDCNSGGIGGLGGGINNNGALKISNSALEDNLVGQAGSPGMCVIYDPLFLPGQPGSGGGLANRANVSLLGSTLQGNQGGREGGGLSNHGTAYLSGNTISSNSATLGGGLSNQDYLEIEGSRMISNTADKGGGIYNVHELHMLSGALSGSNAFLGGGIYNQGQAFLAGVLVQDNWTRNGPDGADEKPCTKTPCPPGDGGSPHGGGIYNDGNMQFDQGVVSGNATGDGGKGGNAELINAAANGGNGGFGGGIFNDGTFTLNFTPVFSNTTGDGGTGGTSPYGDGQDGTGGFGGGIYNSGAMTVTLANLTGNHTGSGPAGAGAGGGIANLGNLSYSNGSITNNQTSPAGAGGGIFTSSQFTLNASSVLNNAGGGNGGGIFAAGGRLYGSNDLFAHNAAGSGYQGSGLYIDSTETGLLHASLSQNSGGGGSAITVLGSSLQMTNTILVSHTIGISVALGAEALLENTLWGTGAWANETDWTGSGSVITGTNNFRLKPGFSNPANLDYHLASSSAAIDRGVSSEVSTDIDDQPRPDPSTGLPDLGADEFWENVPITAVDISAPLTGTTHTSISFTATISPTTATPNILYYWFPAPDSGQWTNTATYRWKRPGEKTVQVSAIQAGSILSVTHTISLEAGVLQIFFPVINR